ncbi:MAG: 23S rRNA (guanosine(2251)-2'-O)-methyltransferase RlmB [Actinomycetota bacterium]
MARDQIEGRNPVREALRAGRPITRLLVADGAAARGPLAEIISSARAAGVRVDRVPREKLDRMATSRAHQGVIAETEGFRYRSWREGLARAQERGEKPLLLALDGITDPGNLGALLRSAEAAGAHGVVIPSRRAAEVTAVVEKASAGALGHLILDRVVNLNRALEEIRTAGVWVVGLDGGAPGTLWTCELLTEPVALVIGAEGRGLSRLIAERADALVRIPMAGRIGSLNAASAGAVALFETARRRHA